MDKDKIVAFYVDRVIRGKQDIETVPEKIRKEVSEIVNSNI